jgi:hypothetical protein
MLTTMNLAFNKSLGFKIKSFANQHEVLKKFEKFGE